MSFDSSQLKFANNLKEAMTFCVRGFSYRMQLFEACKMLDQNPNYRMTKSCFTRATTYGAVRYLSADGLVGVDFDNTVPANQDPASDCSLMWRYLHVHRQHRNQGLFKRTVEDVTEIYRAARFCGTLAVKPESEMLREDEEIQGYLQLKQSMQKQFEKCGWIRLSLLAFAAADGEIITRNEDPVYGCISMVLIGEKVPDRVAEFYRSMKFGRDVL